MTGATWIKHLGPLALVALIGGVAPAQGQAETGAKGPDGLPGIFWLIKQEDMTGIAVWLDSGGDIEARGYHGASPLVAAEVIDNWPAVLYLPEGDARADIADGRGYTLGFLAMRSRVTPEGRYRQALARVRAILVDRGLLPRIYELVTVRQMKSEGRWPPVAR